MQQVPWFSSGNESRYVMRYLAALLLPNRKNVLRFITVAVFVDIFYNAVIVCATFITALAQLVLRVDLCLSFVSDRW